MKRFLPLLIVLLAAPSWAAEKDEPATGDDDSPTLFERLMVTPERDAFTDGDRKRAELERSLPGMTDAAPAKSGLDLFLDAIANADVNQASPGQKAMIEKLNDPDFNRLPR